MILLLSTSDTDLLSASASPAEYRVANPSFTPVSAVEELAQGCRIAVVRLLGSIRIWEDGIAELKRLGLAVVVVSGEQSPDALLMEASTVPANISVETHHYLAHGGPDNLTQLWNFLSDTILYTGLGFSSPTALPEWGYRTGWENSNNISLKPATDTSLSRAPRVAVVYYRAQEIAGNTAYIDALCEAIAARGAVPVPLYTASLRRPHDDLLTVLGSADVAIVTVLAAGGNIPAHATAGGDDEAWDVEHLAALNIPILQGLCLTTSRAAWKDSEDGLSALDVARQVAVPEFDGRIITIPFSFKEMSDDGIPRYVADTERCAQLASTAFKTAALGLVDAPNKRVAILLSAYPTKHARIGNAVGLDTPASVVEVLRQMRAAGYDLGTEPVAGLDTESSDDLITELIKAGGQDPDWLTDEKLSANPHRIPLATYSTWFDAVDADLRDAVVDKWGEAPGSMYVDYSHNPQGDICVAAIRYGNVLIMIQPPRGFGDNPVAIYHDPDLAPSHHYLAAYSWLKNEPAAGGFGAHAIIHMGKHGNLEWLPGKAVGLSAQCGPDATISDIPLIYPFLVNDPGEGSQAKRRAHAVLIDHLIPPMARAESYGDIARLEQLLDEHAQVTALDPAKLPAIRQQIWTLLQAAEMDRELGWKERPEEDIFDDMIMHIDGWLCEIKDVQIRDGLHVLSAVPQGEQLVDLVTAILRARQLWGGERRLIGLREALGLSESGTRSTEEVDAMELLAKSLVSALQEVNWQADQVDHAFTRVTLPPSANRAEVRNILVFTCEEVVPRLQETVGEVPAVLHALAGHYTPAGPSGSPLRGLVNVLPTGRNFYSVDPRAMPSLLAWETGIHLADSLIERYKTDTGEYPKSVGISVWGTSAMRTSGDDIAEIFALLGVQPHWDEASRRITSVSAIPLAELGRPRIDVTVRISGFFRDAFPHVIDLIDDAVNLVAALDEDPADNYIRANYLADIADNIEQRQATTRIFGSKPGTYGAGILQLIDSKQWRSDADLAEVYTTWGGYAYGKQLNGAPASDTMRRSYARMSVAAKNVDSLEHDIADSDDYFQYHGGMIATVRALSGSDPVSYVGDSTRPDTIRTRTLSEEVSRVFRARVVNPRWLAAMRRHGYKGAFEMAATVDYLFGYDATTSVVSDWMYEKLATEYLFNPENADFMQQSNPWAMHGIAERLLEAANRNLWEQPEEGTLEKIQQVMLDTEGRIEDHDATH